MPTPELMTWIAVQRRWTKMYAGRRYYISARKLGCPETKDGSIHAANQWWRDKQAELDYAIKAAAAARLRVPQPMDDLFAAHHGVKQEDLTSLRDLCEQALLREERDRIRGKQMETALPGAPPGEFLEMDIDSLPTPEDEEDRRRGEIMAVLEKMLFGPEAKMSHEAARKLAASRVQDVELAVESIRGAGKAAAAVPATVQAKVNEWLGGQQTRASVGEISPNRLKTLRSCIAHFCVFAGPDSNVQAVNAAVVDSFRGFCLSRIADKRIGIAGWSEERAKQVLGVAKSFIHWLWEREEIELPRNLNRLSVRVYTKSIVTWTVEEVRSAIGSTQSKTLRVALLLMANCGFTQKDVSDLADSEVDWKMGTITRKRSKAKKYEKAPTVTYRLWPVTFDLLKSLRSRKPTVLLTQTGRPLVRAELIDGKVRQNDQLITKFRKLRKRLGITKSMKQLRKTSSSLLKTNAAYDGLSQLFLGHSPATIEEKHYTLSPQSRLDEAILWLGRQYGFIE